MNAKRHKQLAIAALVFISLVLRPPIAAVGSLLDEIAKQLNLDSAQAGLLTAIPVFCFGLGAFISPLLIKRLGLNHAMFLTLALLGVSLIVRLWFGYSILLLGTVLVGLSIAVANVLLPTFVRVDFPGKASMLTSVYTTLLAIAASFAAAFAVPWSQMVGGWQIALLTPMLPLLLAIGFWWPRIREFEPELAVSEIANRDQRAKVYLSFQAWAILFVFGLQSLGFYALLGWLPTMLISAGLQPSEAGGMLGFATAIGIPSGFALAPLIAKSKSLSWLIALASLLTTLGFVLLAVLIGSESVTSPWLFVALLLVSFGQTATFPMSLSLIATRAATKAQTTTLSVMSQGWGYLIAGLGTFVIGLAGDWFGWSTAALVLAALTALQLAFGFAAGRATKIGA